MIVLAFLLKIEDRKEKNDLEESYREIGRVRMAM
jgi:hypothetical protein